MKQVSPPCMKKVCSRQLLQRREPQRTVCSSRGTRPRNCPPQRTASPTPHTLHPTPFFKPEAGVIIISCLPHLPHLPPLPLLILPRRSKIVGYSLNSRSPAR